MGVVLLCVKIGEFLDEANAVWGQLGSLLLHDRVYIVGCWVHVVLRIRLVLLVLDIGLLDDGQAPEVGHGSQAKRVTLIVDKGILGLVDSLLNLLFLLQHYLLT